MEITELRLNNWVKCYNMTFQVDCIDYTGYIQGFKGSQGEFRIGDCEGIPLTPQILEKVGFKKHADGWKISYYKNVSPVFKSYTWLYTEQTDISFKFWMKDEMILVCKHFHQLQNLFFMLCGKELPINL